MASRREAYAFISANGPTRALSDRLGSRSGPTYQGIEGKLGNIGVLLR